MTEEQEVIDAVTTAKIALDSPEADELREIVAEKAAELDGFVEASNAREKAMLARQAAERDEFSKTELERHGNLVKLHKGYQGRLALLAENYGRAVDALRAHYGKVYPQDGDPVESIRKVLRGDAHPGAEVRTFEDDQGNIITRIRRGLHGMGAGAPNGLSLFGSEDGPPDAPEGPPEADKPMDGRLDAGNITEALERGAETIGEKLGPLGLDFSLDAAEKG